MAEIVGFKVFMSSNDGLFREVRRFGIEADAVTNFLYLREKLQVIFPSLKGRQFTVSWRDADNDDVLISSDEELQIALQETNSDTTRKLYVNVHSEGTFNRIRDLDSANSGPIHFNIICDGCEKQIQGFRYKCMQCQDYDLCMNCEGHGTHSEHCMIRLPGPMQWSSHNARRLANHINRFVRKEYHHAAKEEEKKNCPFKNGKYHGKSRHCGETKNWMDMLSTYLDDWANLPGDCPIKKMNKESSEKPNQENPQPTTSAEAKAQSSKENRKSSQDLINNAFTVGEDLVSFFLNAALNPQLKKASAPTPPASEAGSPSSDRENSPVAEKDVPSSNEASASPKFPGEGKKLRETVTDENVSASAQSPPAAEKSDKASLENEGWFVLNKSGTTSPNAASQPPSTTGAVPKQPQASASTEASLPSVYPKLPVSLPEPDIPIMYHPNPKIQKSVERMIQMGFSNEGGWLTNLLVSKDGDISAALDALSPIRR